MEYAMRYFNSKGQFLFSFQQIRYN